MNTAIPFVFEPKRALRNGETYIAVAVVHLPEHFSRLSAHLLSRAFVAAIERRDIVIGSHGAYFLKIVAVHVFNVVESAKPAALAGIRETLEDLEFHPFATIATYTADQIWVTIQSGVVNEGTTNFEALFLRREYIEQAQTILKESDNTLAQSLATGTGEFLKLLAKGQDKTNPL